MAIPRESSRDDRPTVAPENKEIEFPITIHRDDLRAALNEFLGKTAANVIMNYLFPSGIKSETLTEKEFKTLKYGLRELLGTQADLIISLITMD